MVCNIAMTDLELITQLGGPARVAELLGFDKATGTQRVFNWTKRESGIPAQVKLDFPQLFQRKPQKTVA